ncbi:hypothetical protein BH11PLA1_BH11PLA1_01450 [soil metagenome]
MLAASTTAALTAGCARALASRSTGAELSDPSAANALAVRGGELIESDPEKARELLDRALALDPYCGIARNNLGALALQGGASGGAPDLFAAAENFQSAAMLMPGNPAPRLNLGLVMERAGLQEEALGAYTTAVEIAPAHIASVQALTSLELRMARESTETRARLKTIALRGTSAEWRAWAKDRLGRNVQDP